MANNEYVNEYEKANDAVRQVLSHLSGEGTKFCLGEDPTRKYSIGILSPQKPETEQSSRTSNQRRPTSLGFETTLEYASTIKLRIEIGFALYWRAIPTWEEQLESIPESTREKLSTSSGETRLRLKFMREEVKTGAIELTINGLSTDEPLLDSDVSTVNDVIKEKISEVTANITKNENCWPAGAKDMPIPDKYLESKEKYESFLKTMATKAKEQPKWAAQLNLKFWPSSKNTLRVAALLSNNAEEDTENKHSQSLMSSGFSIELENSRYVAYPYAAAESDYRYSSESWGRGINCVLKVKDGRVAQTETTPIHYQVRTETRSEMNSACQFSRLGSSESFEALEEISSWLKSYAANWKNENTHYINDASSQIRKNDLQLFEEEISRYEAGVAALHADPRLNDSFKMANKAFAMGQHKGWRLFQLVFVVSQLPSLLAREKKTPELLEALNRVDVLWFPTGGGKTEAYFGVIATALFYDRLRGKNRGVTAWLRYPLRMLSIQQLQRLMEIVVFSDLVRQQSNSKLLTDGEPFSLGYYVGEKNTPNYLTSSFDNQPNKKLLDLKRQMEQTNKDDNPLLVLQRCPFPDCKSPELSISIDLKYVRVNHVCDKCQRSMPIYITDTEIYRYTPSIIVGTVDRLARAGQTSEFGHLFGRAKKYCPDHGYTNFSRCLENGKGVCERKVSELIDCEELYDPAPSLLLQDELHLLRESLGTYDSHYETFIDLLCEKIGSGLPPKRLAATATIEGYKAHIKELYARDAVRFPVKGMLDNESAYVTPSTSKPIARLYVGILPTGSDTKEVVTNIVNSIKDYSDRYYESNKSSNDSEVKSLIDNYDLSLAYVNQKNTAGDLRSSWDEDHNIQVLTGDRGLSEVRATIGRVESDQNRNYDDRLKYIVATSVISHGVDLERLNYMAFAGMPSAASDYIQASSRVGRTHVGVVFTVIRPQDNRERNIYQRFYEYHDRLYQLVQPVPINRVSQSAIARTITGILGACIVNILGYEKGADVGGYDSGRVFAKALEDNTISIDELIELARKAFAIDNLNLPSDAHNLIDAQIQGLVRDARRMIRTEEDQYRTTQRMRPQPVSSLREVSEQVGFDLNYHTGKVVSQIMQAKDDA